jgi:hypothetical protein
MAKIAATKLNLTDALIWIDKELNGYGDLTVEDLPPYRRPMGIPQGYNPVHGWQPIHFPDTKTANICSEAFIGLALGAIEKKMLRPTVDCVHFFGFATGTGSPMWHMCHTAGVMQRQNQCPVTLITTCDRHRGEHFPLAQSAPWFRKPGAIWSILRTGFWNKCELRKVEFHPRNSLRFRGKSTIIAAKLAESGRTKRVG